MIYNINTHTLIRLCVVYLYSSAALDTMYQYLRNPPVQKERPQLKGQ